MPLHAVRTCWIQTLENRSGTPDRNGLIYVDAHIVGASVCAKVPARVLTGVTDLRTRC